MQSETLAERAGCGRVATEEGVEQSQAGRRPANSGAPSPAALPLGPAQDGTGTGGAKAWLSGAFSVVRFALGYFGSGGGRRRRGRRRTQK